jgi:hypothetical protein
MSDAAVELSGAGAAAYLENFPAGAYRAEVQEILDTRLIVELAEYRVAPSSQIVVTLYNMPGDADDHLSIMPPGTPDDQYLRRFQTGGIVDGTVTIEAPSRTGERELRVYFGDTDIVQKRIRLIVDPAVTADNPLGGAAVAEASPNPTPAPAPPPNPGPRPTPAPTPGGPPVLAVAGTPIYAGQRIVINYSGFAGNEREWVTIVAPGAVDTAYAGYTYTTGQAGTVTYPLVLAAGVYELRAVAERPALRVIARLPIEIVALTGEVPGATIALAQPATAGQPIQVRFAGVPDMPGTWITVIREGTADTEWGAFVRAPAGNAGEVTLPAQPAGRYELRFLAENPSRVVIARLPITIE